MSQHINTLCALSVLCRYSFAVQKPNVIASLADAPGQRNLGA